MDDDGGVVCSVFEIYDFLRGGCADGGEVKGFSEYHQLLTLYTDIYIV